MRPSLECLGCACVLLLAACKAYDASLIDPLRGARSAGAAGHNDPACAPERCNGRDDDCDGVIDEQVDADCQRDHAETRCVTGQCVLTDCMSGYSDCNADSSDGCERAEQDLACGHCGADCDASADPSPLHASDSGSGIKAPPPEQHIGSDAAPPHANDDDNDAGLGCGAEPERCDGKDNDCDGAIDEGDACNACVTANPTGQTAACDQCVCSKCAADLAVCSINANPTWVQRCVGVMQCYGKNNLADKCPDADCYQADRGPCAAQITIGSLSPVPPNPINCTADPVSTPCGAFGSLRTLCLQTTCAAVCKF